MRDHPKEVTLPLSDTRWAVLVDALQRRRSQWAHQVAEDTNGEQSILTETALDSLDEINQLLAILDPIGELESGTASRLPSRKPWGAGGAMEERPVADDWDQIIERWGMRYGMIYEMVRDYWGLDPERYMEEIGRKSLDANLTDEERARWEFSDELMRNTHVRPLSDEAKQALRNWARRNT